MEKKYSAQAKARTVFLAEESFTTPIN